MPRQHLIFAIVTSLFLGLLQLAKPELMYQRDLIMAGEWWRLVSGHFVHVNLPHLLLNLAGLWLLLLLCHSVLGVHLLLVSLPALAGLIGLSLLILHPQIQWYVGLSGILYGLFILGGIRLTIAGETLTGLALLTIILAKSLLDLWQGNHGPSQSLINASVITQAHWYGMSGGVLLALLGALSNPPDRQK